LGKGPSVKHFDVSSLDPVVDAEVFEKTRATMGVGFIKLISYFGEDGAKAVAEIEAAQREGNATRMVMPAHTMKSEARQFGAMPLGDLAEKIEHGARRCVEIQEAPDELLVHVAKLRPLFTRTMQVLERETNPLQERRKPVFGRGGPHNQGFGRI
jgi:HPt (histidine-containing phosphotransfer) domain-containing protein